MSEPALHPDQQRALDYFLRKGTQAPVERIREQLRTTFAAIEAAFDAVPSEQRERQPAPGKWSPHEILDHLVLSHQPAIEQLASLLRGVSPGGVAIPAGLHRDERPPWDDLRRELGAIHAAIAQLVETAADDTPLAAKAVVEMVLKIDGEPRHWYEPFDWKAFVQTLRVHTLEHQNQLARTVSA